MVFVPVFPILTPPSALCFDTPPVLSVLRGLLGNPSVVRLLLPCISAGFLSYSGHSLLRVLPCPSGCLSALRDCFSSCLLWFSTWPPFGMNPDSFDLCFFGSSCLPLLVSFLFVYTPFLCLVRSWRSLRVVFTRWVQLVFSWCLISFGVGSFLGCFWFLPVRVAFTLLLLPLVFFGLRFPSRWGLPLGWVPGFSRYFSFFFLFFFMFLRFRPLPSSLVGLVPLFLLPAVVSFLLRSFRAVSIFSFFSALPRVLCPLFSSSGSSLGLLCPALGSGHCGLLWVSLTSSCRVAILRAVSSAVSSSACSCF